jgi:predicted acetyltransferase
MLRIIDMKKAFEFKRYSPELKGEVVFKVEDQLAPWNDGTFSLVVEKGEARLNKTSKLYQFSCDIRTISQIYCGYLDLIQAANIGQLTIKNNTDLLKINKYFRESTPYMSDRF